MLPESGQSDQILVNHPLLPLVSVPSRPVLLGLATALRTPQWLRDRRVRGVCALCCRKSLPVVRLRHAACSRFRCGVPAIWHAFTLIGAYSTPRPNVVKGLYRLMVASRPQNESFSTASPASAGNAGGHGSSGAGRLRQPQQQMTRPSRVSPSAQFRGWRWTLAVLFIVSLLLAGWVWFQLLHSIP